MANLPTRTNNPGDIKDTKTGTFRTFNSPTEGFDALKKDLQAKVTGNTSTKLGPNSTLRELAYTWAPPSDNNDSERYTQTLAQKTGATPDTPISTIDIDKLSSAIADAEGYQGGPAGTPPAKKLSSDEFAQRIKSKYPQYNELDNKTLTGRILSKYPQYNTILDTGVPAAHAQESTDAPYGYVKPPAFNPIATPEDTSKEGQPKKGLAASIIEGAGKVLSGAEKPFIGVAAIPTQLAAKALGRPDPFAAGVPGGLPGKPTNTDVTPLDLEKKAGDVAQVGSYFVPGSTGLKAVAGAAGTGLLQGAGAAMSEGKSLPDVATQGAFGTVLGGGLAGAATVAGTALRGVGDTLSGTAANKALQGIKDAYASALNLNARERAFEMKGGKDLAQVLLDHSAPLGRYENGTLDASGSIPILQDALTPLNEKADAIVQQAEGMGINPANGIHIDEVLKKVVQRIRSSNVDSLAKEKSIKAATKLFEATRREYGDILSPGIAEQIKRGMQSSAFKKALTTSDAISSNATYLASNEMRDSVERSLAASVGKDVAAEYKKINLQRSDLTDAIKRLTDLDGVRLLKGGRLGNMAGGVVGAISGAASGLGGLGALAGDYFGTKAAEFMNNPATKIASAKLKQQALGLAPKAFGDAGAAVGKGASAVGSTLLRGARAIGLAGNLIAK